MLLKIKEVFLMNELARINEFKSILNSQTIRAQIAKSMGENAGSFFSSMIDLYNSDTGLQNCNPQEVVAECVKAAALKLPIVKSLGFAYVVPYKNKPTFIIGYKGLIQLAQRTGKYLCINTDIVYEGELKSFDKLSGMIDLSGERISDKPVGYFAYIKLVSGFEKTLYMSVEEVERWKLAYSKSHKSSYSPWQTEFDKMAQKTVLRRLISTYGYMTIEMANSITKDEYRTEDNIKEEIKVKANKKTIDLPDSDVIEKEQNPQKADEEEIIEAEPAFA